MMVVGIPNDLRRRTGGTTVNNIDCFPAIRLIGPLALPVVLSGRLKFVMYRGVSVHDDI